MGFLSLAGVRFWRLWLILSLLALSLIMVGKIANVPGEAGANAYQEQATVYNCDGTEWAFRFSRMADGSVGISYGYAPIGGNRAAINWQSDVSIGGVTGSVGDISAQCVIGRVFVFARFTNPVDGSARLYERHGFPGDLANGYGGGFSDGWYHWR